MNVDAARLAKVISPLRRTLLALAATRERLPDIPDAQVEIVRALPAGTATSPGALARDLGLRRPTVSNLLSAMETRGLVARTPRADDRRRVDVVATEEALAYFRRFDDASAAIVAEASASLTPDERARLDAAIPVLERLRDLLVETRRASADERSRE